MGASIENESVPTLTEPQTWTLIISAIAVVIAMMTLISTLFVRIIKTEIGGVTAQLGALNTKIEGLDRDVQALVKRNFGLDRG